MKRISILVVGVFFLTGCESGIPDAPLLYSPGDGVKVSHPTFVWQTVGDEYELQLADDSTFATVKEVWSGLVDTTYTPIDSLTEGIYYWRVRAKTFEWGEWSEVFKFYVGGLISLLSPQDADTIKQPALVWSAFRGADNYHLYVYQGQPQAGDLVIDTTLSDTFYQISDSLYPATYYWMIEVENVWSDTSRFVTYTLDETFFPVGPDFIWDYMQVYSSWGRFGDNDDTSYYSIEVTTFTWNSDSLYVVLNDGHYFTGNEYIYKNDSVFFYCDRPALQSISLIPRDGEPMYDHESDQERPDLWAEMDSDSTFHWGDTWGNGGEPYHDYWIRECWQRNKGMYLFYEGESYHYNNPDEEHPNGEWLRKKILINLDKGE